MIQIMAIKFVEISKDGIYLASSKPSTCQDRKPLTGKAPSHDKAITDAAKEFVEREEQKHDLSQVLEAGRTK